MSESHTSGDWTGTPTMQWIPGSEQVPGWRQVFTPGGIGVISPDTVKVRRASRHNMWFQIPGVRRLSFIGVYWPNTGQDQARAEFHSMVDDAMEEGDLIVGGDFNYRCRRLHDTKTDAEGKSGKEFLAGLQLTDLGLNGTLQGMYTRCEVRTCSRTGVIEVQRSCPDTVAVSTGALGRIISASVGSSLGSDHCMLIITLRGAQPHRRGAQPSVVPRRAGWRVRGADASTYRRNIDSRLSSILPMLRQSSPEDATRMLTSVVIAGAEEVIGRSSGAPGGPWTRMADGVRGAYRVMRTAEVALEHLRCRAPSHEQLEEALRNAQAAIKCFNAASRRDRGRRQAALRIALDERTSRGAQFWKTWQDLGSKRRTTALPGTLQDDDGICITDDAAKVMHILRYFETLYSDDVERDQGIYDEEWHCTLLSEVRCLDQGGCYEDDNINIPFTEHEILRHIKRLKRGTAPGHDDILPEMLLWAVGSAEQDAQPDDCTPLLVQALTIVMNKVLTSMQWSTPWRTGVQKVIPKTSGAVHLNQHRGLAMQPVMAKVLMSVMAARIAEETDSGLQDEQNGFRARRSSAEHVLVLSEMLRHRRSLGLPTIAIFIDLRKAYDKVSRLGLLYRLWTKGVRGRLWHLLRDRLDLVLLTMREAEAHTSCRSHLGVPQGASDSPLLFSLYIDSLISDLKASNIGISVSGRRVPGLFYADDICILVDSPGEVTRALNVVAAWCYRWRMRINGAKSAYLVFGDAKLQEEAEDSIIPVLGEDIMRRQSYKYLGILVTVDLTWSAHIRHVIRTATVYAQRLAYMVNKGRRLSARTATYLFTTAIRPMLEYGAEIWGPDLTVQQMQDIERIQTRYLAAATAPREVDQHAWIRFEVGAPRLSARRDVLLFRVLKKLSAGGEQRLPALVLNRSFQARSAWAANVLRRINTYVFPRLEWAPLTQVVLVVPEEAAVYEYDDQETRRDLSRLQTTREMARQIRWGKQPRQYAVATADVHRHRSHVCEAYQDSHDIRGVDLKKLLRADRLPTNLAIAQRLRVPELGACGGCASQQPESREHVLLHCDAHDEHRARLFQRMDSAFVTAGRCSACRHISPAVMPLSEADRFWWALGRRSGCCHADDSVDDAVKQFLKRVFPCWPPDPDGPNS